jgi:hypothetical protein
MAVPHRLNPKGTAPLQGRQSPAGARIQHVTVEVQDVNPLYGRDTYGGNLTRPSPDRDNNL